MGDLAEQSCWPLGCFFVPESWLSCLTYFRARKRKSASHCSATSTAVVFASFKVFGLYDPMDDSTGSRDSDVKQCNTIYYNITIEILSYKKELNIKKQRRSVR